MLEDFQGDSWGSIPPLRMSSLLPHDLCHGWSASCWPPTLCSGGLSLSRVTLAHIKDPCDLEKPTIGPSEASAWNFPIAQRNLPHPLQIPFIWPWKVYLDLRCLVKSRSMETVCKYGFSVYKGISESYCFLMCVQWIMQIICTVDKLGEKIIYLLF